MDLSNLRQEYSKSQLNKADLLLNPLEQLVLWLKQAKDTQTTPANAMSLATSNLAGKVSIRTVLLQSIANDKLYFYSHYASQKAQDMAENPQAALLFTWLNLERQVQIIGSTIKTSQAQSQTYFNNRPRQSQLTTWASKQSEVINNRKQLEQNYQFYQKKFHNQPVPLPNFWGGYEVRIEQIEFWQGGNKRLHDRFLYQKKMDNQWSITRISP